MLLLLDAMVTAEEPYLNTEHSLLIFLFDELYFSVHYEKFHLHFVKLH